MSEKKDNLKNSGLYVACFFVAVLLIVILFFVKKDDIASNLKKTDFFERVGVSTPEFIQNHSVQEPALPTEEEIELDIIGNTSTVTLIKEQNLPEKENSSSAENLQSNKNELSDIVGTTSSKSKEQTGTQTAVQTPKPVQTTQNNQSTESVKIPSTRTTTLYFVAIGSDGSVNRKSVKRELPKSDSPLTDAIRTLIAGPIPSESGCMNLIPAGTRLIGASVKDGVATLNFSENFEFNTYGVEGCIAQLMQVVYTATEFSTVKSVQFLIEGEKKDYLGTEGQWIGSPLARTLF